MTQGLVVLGKGGAEAQLNVKICYCYIAALLYLVLQQPYSTHNKQQQ